MDETVNAETMNEMLRTLEKERPRAESAYRAAVLLWVVLIMTAVLSTVDRDELARAAAPAISEGHAVASLVGTPPAEPEGGEPEGNVVDYTY